MDATARHPTARPLWRDPRAHALLMAATLNIMTNATVSPALPGLAAEFAGTAGVDIVVPLLVSAPSLTIALSAPFCGWAVDRVGRRRLLLVGVMLFAAIGTAGAILPGLGAILASRFLLGLPMALIMTAQTALVGDYYAGETRSRLSSYQIAAINWGGFVFITAASTLAAVSPRLPFAVYLLPLAFLPFMWRALVDPPGIGRRAEGPRPADGAGRGWIAVLAVAALLQVATSALFFLMPTQIPFYAVASGLDAPSTTGIVLGALMLAGGVGALVTTRLRTAIGRSAAIGLGFALMAAGFALMTALDTAAGLTLPGAMIGFGFGVVGPHLITLALDATPAARRGAAAGTITTSMYLGRFLSPLGSGPMILAHGFAATYLATAAALAALATLVPLAGQMAPTKKGPR